MMLKPSYSTTGNGELQVAMDGKALSMYNYIGEPDQDTGTAKAEIRTWYLVKDLWEPSVFDIEQLPIGNNKGKGSLLHTGTEIYYTQRTVENNNEKTMVVRASDKAVVATQIGDLRANKNHKFYNFAEGTDNGLEYNLTATNIVNLNNVPPSENGTTGYQPYQPYVVKGATLGPTRGVVYRNVGEKHYELKDHLGNVRVVVSDRKNLDTDNNILSANVVSYNNYYPFGMPQPNRNFDSQEYRYGFNGKENDNELKGNALSVDFGARLYDSRIGRFSSLDPLAKKNNEVSPYAFVVNNPMRFIDKNGKDPIDPRTGKPYKINLNQNSVIHHSVDYALKNPDITLLDRINAPFYQLFPRGQRGGARGEWAEGHAKVVLDYTAQSISKASHQLVKDFLALPSHSDYVSATQTSNPFWKKAASSGTYSFIEPTYAETNFYMDRSIAKIFSVKENYIDQIITLRRNANDEFEVTMRQEFEIEKGEIKTRETESFFGLRKKTEMYRTLKITETTEVYHNNEKVTQQTKTYTREEKIKK